MPALQGMRKDIEASKAEGGMIMLADAGKFEGLHSHVSVEALSKLPKAQRDIQLGELRPDLVQQYYGSKDATLDAVKDSTTALRDQTGQGNGSAAQSLRTALASNNVQGIIDAIAQGAPVPTSAAFLKIAEQNPALAGIPAVAGMLAAQSQKQEAPPRESTAQETDTPKPVQAAPQPGSKTASPQPARITASNNRPAGLPKGMQEALAKAKKTVAGGTQVSGGSDAAGQASAFPAPKDGEKLPGTDAKNKATGRG